MTRSEEFLRHWIWTQVKGFMLVERSFLRGLFICMNYVPNAESIYGDADRLNRLFDDYLVELKANGKIKLGRKFVEIISFDD